MLGTILSIYSLFDQKSQADQAANRIREAGEKNAQLAEIETDEQLRRERYAFLQEQGQRVVAYAKAGVSMEGTPLTVLSEAATVAEREMAFTRKQGARTAAARRAGASGQARSMERQGTSLLIEGIGKVGNKQNWWGL